MREAAKSHSENWHTSALEGEHMTPNMGHILGD
jgi:hypothetical protein